MLIDILEMIAEFFVELVSGRSEKKGWTFVSILIAVAAGCLLAVLCGLEFGLGFEYANNPGSQENDNYAIKDGKIVTLTNHCGGILGGITNGMPVLFRVAVKPTPSISKPQQSVCLSKGEITSLEVKGRHDPCIVPRAVPVVEAAAAIAIYDLILGNTQTVRRK